MPIPDYQAIMLPLLKFAEDKQEHSLIETVSILANQFNLTEDEKNELLPSGGKGRFYNRVSWARTYLKKAGLLSYPRRGFFTITSRGIQLLLENPQDITAKFLKKHDEFVQFIEIKNDNDIKNIEDKTIVETPEEILESAHQKLQENLSGEILESIKKCSPYFFKYLVVDLLVSMGY